MNKKCATSTHSIEEDTPGKLKTHVENGSNISSEDEQTLLDRYQQMSEDDDVFKTQESGDDTNNDEHSLVDQGHSSAESKKEKRMEDLNFTNKDMDANVSLLDIDPDNFLSEFFSLQKEHEDQNDEHSIHSDDTDLTLCSEHEHPLRRISEKIDLDHRDSEDDCLLVTSQNPLNTDNRYEADESDINTPGNKDKNILKARDSISKRKRSLLRLSISKGKAVDEPSPTLVYRKKCEQPLCSCPDWKALIKTCPILPKDIFWAASLGCQEAVFWWLDNGLGNINSVTSKGEGLIHAAATCEDPNMLHHLLMYGDVHLNIKDALGRTPVMMAAFYGRILHLRILLTSNIKCLADLMITDVWGSRVLQLAYRWRAWKAVQTLLLCGNVHNNQDLQELLISAQMHGQDMVVDMLSNSPYNL
ncbi:unnamed protein product [Meganyctiphanes norvegica]|uniref:Uncharacterized protein n=1 Tax=Meganyctiphanes norvegica TaxID=48144 RepID=A0AAV2RRH8_MEGNR